MSRASARRSRSKTRPHRKALRLEPLEERRLLNGEFWLSALSITGQPDRPFDKLEVTFSNPVNAATFDSSDIVLSRSGVDLQPTVTQLDTTRFELDFGGQSGLLDYTLVIGPDIADTGGQDLDQNRDGTAGDSYEAALYTTDMAITAGDTTYDDQSLILYGGTATIDGPHSFADVQVLGGATLTHSAATTTEEYRLELAINDSLIVDANSKIDVTARGYLPGYTLGNTTVGAATGWAGGSYGGQGVGPTNETYGDYRDPNELGSGGSSDHVGKPGGGLIRIEAANMQVDGAIRADGSQETVLGHSTAAGSGGGIRLDAGTISGGGLISARGATEWWDGEQSGGGRIAVYYDTNGGFDLENNVTTAYSASIYGPAPGTVYLEQTGGPSVLRIASPEIPAGAKTPIPGSELNVDQLIVSGLNVYATFKDEMTIDVGELIVSDNATLEVATPNPTDVAMVDTLELTNGAVLTHRAATTTDEYTLRLEADTVTVDATSSIDVSARGYLPGRTLGNTTVGAATGWAGGSYGGEGVGPTNETYGDFRDPNELGSGGSADYAGKAGGGLVRIDANTLQLDGTILANGGQETVAGHSHASGSGGGIRIDVGTLSGSGWISAKGGTEWWDGEQSGGGRIAVYYDTNSGFDLENKVTTAAGGSVHDPAPGTVYIEQVGGDTLLRITSPEIPAGAKTPIPGSGLNVDRLVVSGKNVYAMPKDTMSMDVGEITVSDGATFEVALPNFEDTFDVATVDLLNGGVLTHRAANATQEFALRMTVGTLTIDSTSAVDATNRGYMAGHTYGNTTVGAATGIAGGSYGGLGEAFGDTTNWVYGDYRDPNELGSGGGGNQRDQGGGLVRIVADTINLDGAIRADGKSTGTGGNDWPSPGSGGGIRLDVGTLGGTGVISSIGGWGGWNRGPGSGGRIAVYYDTLDSFDLGNVTAAGGGEGATGDDNAAAPGTVYLIPSSGPDVLRIASQYRPTAAWTPLVVDDPSLDLLEISGDGLKVGADGRTTLRAQDVVVMDGATLELASLAGDPGLVCENLSVVNGSTLTHRKTTIYNEYFLRVFADTVTIDDTSQIDVTALGYDRGYTVGNTTTGASTVWAGGSYGGLGGAGKGEPNAVYDDPANPKHPGSGGAGLWYSNDAEGGGCVLITAETFTLDGEIHADASNTQYVGGSGGGVRLNVATLNGTGTITAAGGGGIGDAGAGGGGRIAIYARDENTLPPENVTALGGTISYYDGEDGTVVYPTEPLFDWDWPLDEFWHDTERLRWTGLGLDPAEVTVDLEAFNGLDVYPLASGLAPVGLFDWDTTAVPDDRYEVRAIFRDSGGTPLETLRREDVLINNSVVWHEGTIYGNQTWAGGEVHVLSKTVSVTAGATLTIEPGAIVKFAPGRRIQVADGGTLEAPATETDPIIITLLTDDAVGGDTNCDGSATRPSPGQSRGIWVVGSGQANLSQYVELRYIVVNHAGTIAADQTWSGALLHRVTGNITVPDGVTLTIEPGAIVKMNDDLTITVEAGGQLLAEGTVAEPIMVTSIHDDTIGGDTTGNGNATTPSAGDWLGIYADGGHAELDHVRVYYAGGSLGGSYDQSAAVRNLSGGTLTVNACLVQDAFFDGFRTQGGPVTITNTIIVDADRAISAAGSSLEVVNCTLDGNRIGVQIHGSAATIANTIISNSLEYGVDWDMGATAPIVRYSNVWGSGTADFHNHFGEPDPVPGADGIISADPLYVDRAGGVYELGAGSPALDGADSFVSPAQDMEDRGRFNDTSVVNTGIGPLAYVDLGALERWHVQTDVDLVVTNLQAVLLPNNQIQLDVTIANQGNGDAPGGWLQRFMLQQYSTSSQRTRAPVEIGEVEQIIPLAAGATTEVRVTLPMPTLPSGDYQASVTVDSTNQIIEQLPQGDFNNGYVGSSVVTVDNPDLVAGTTTTGDWNSDGTDRAFDITVAPGQRIQIQFSSPQTPANVYYSSGAMPDPMEFDQHAPAGGAIVVANPGDQAVVGIVRVQAPEAPGAASSYTITTSAMTNGLQTVAPAGAGNSGPVTVMIEGGIFDTNTTFALCPTGSAGAPQIDASKVKIFEGQTTAAATFDLTAAATGSYDVWASWNGTTAQLPSSFDVFDGGAGLFTIELVGPDVVRPDRQLPYRLVWKNQGTNDVPIQYVTIDTPAGVHIAQHPDGKERMDHIELLTFTATTTDYATLPPASSGELDLWLTFDQGELFYDLDMDWLPIDDPELATTPIDWEAILNDAKPPNADQQLWNDVTTDVQNELGGNWGQVLNELVDKAVVDGLSEGTSQGLTNLQNAADAISAGVSLVGKLVGDQVGRAFDRQPVRPGGDGVHRDWVLIVAIEDYAVLRQWYKNVGADPDTYPPDLRGTQRDAAALENYLRNDLWIPSSQIRILRDTIGVTADNIDSVSKIRDAWQDIVQRADADDKIKFFYAGHGGGVGWDPTGSFVLNRIHTGGAEDAIMSGAELNQMIRDFPMPGEMFFFLDCCHSELIGRSLNNVPRLRWNAAALETETAADGDTFTTKWIAAKRERTNDVNQDGKVKLSEAFGFAKNAYQQAHNPGAAIDDQKHPISGGGPDAPDQELHDDIGDAMRRLTTDKTLTREERIKLIRLVNSVDPNEKTGPDGYGQEGFITATDIPYTVYFENDPDQATAAAQVVTITDQLDPNLDWSTFELGEVVFGNTSVVLDGTPTHGYKQVDVPELGIVVDIEAQVDMQTGLATWTITTLDPLTLEPTQDPLAGFLPPNTEPPIGEGHVSFTIQRLASLGTGDSFSNQASIIFDTNDPIVTDPVLNTIDVGAPTSQVDALPAESPPEFTVSWGGADDAGGSGIAHYDVYVAVDRGPWELWKEATTETSATYTGMFWHTYAFYSVTTDNVGYTELPPQDADATTDVVPLELGTVDFMELLDLSPADSEIWYQMQPARTGQMTVIWPATTGTATVALFDAQLTEPPMAVGSGATGRLDGSVQIGETYFIQITGDSADVDLLLANLVVTTGTEIQVFGTDYADAFEFAPTGSYAVTIKGIPYHFDDTQYETIVFTGGLGDDTATLTGAPGDDIARFYPDHGTFGENGFLVTVNDVTAITAHGGGGADSAFMYDSPGDDEFIAREDYGKLSGEGFVLETFDFMYNYGYATTEDGGADVAYMEDTARKDKFKFDWPNPGQFFGKMYGGGVYYNRAKYFEQIVATMTDGTDQVRLFDSEGDETFFGQKGESRLIGEGFDVTVSGYDYLAMYASKGVDIAHLVDSTDDDTTRARPHKITLWGGDYEDPTYTLMARRFDEYHFEAKHGGFDRAKLHDTALSDHVDADGDSATFYKNDGSLELLYETVAFEWVRLYATDGGSQNTIQKKDPVNFELVYDPAMWDEIP